MVIAVGILVKSDYSGKVTVLVPSVLTLLVMMPGAEVSVRYRYGAVIVVLIVPFV